MSRLLSLIRSASAALGRTAIRIRCALAIRLDAGQTTAEYGLVILAAGTLALAAILWARNSGSITDLFETVIDHLTGDLD